MPSLDAETAGHTSAQSLHWVQASISNICLRL